MSSCKSLPWCNKAFPVKNGYSSMLLSGQLANVDLHRWKATDWLDWRRETAQRFAWGRMSYAMNCLAAGCDWSDNGIAGSGSPWLVRLRSGRLCQLNRNCIKYKVHTIFIVIIIIMIEFILRPLYANTSGCFTLSNQDQSVSGETILYAALNK